MIAAFQCKFITTLPPDDSPKCRNHHAGASRAGDFDVHAAAHDEFVLACGLSHAAALAFQMHFLAEAGAQRSHGDVAGLNNTVQCFWCCQTPQHNSSQVPMIAWFISIFMDELMDAHGTAARVVSDFKRRNRQVEGEQPRAWKAGFRGWLQVPLGHSSVQLWFPHVPSIMRFWRGWDMLESLSHLGVTGHTRTRLAHKRCAMVPRSP